MVNDSVEIAEDAAEDERDRVRIRYYSVTHSREETITSCEGDLTVICNVLADYADMLDEFLQTDRERLGFCGALQYERMRDRCRKITAELQEKIGYDRAAAIEKCRRRAKRSRKSDDGVGEDALVLAARRRGAAQEALQQAEDAAGENKAVQT